MWGLRSPTPRGRTESCTLRILSDALTAAHGSGYATVDYGLCPVDYACWCMLWISQPYGLGRIYPGLTAL